MLAKVGNYLNGKFCKSCIKEITPTTAPAIKATPKLAPITFEETPKKVLSPLPIFVS